MERYEKAAQIWFMLTEAAESRKVLYYSDVDSSNPQMVGKLYLEPIQSYCLLEGLPALTVLVVGRATGKPGTGFIGVKNEDITSETQRCFNFDWDEEKKPTPEKLMVAVENYLRVEYLVLDLLQITSLNSRRPYQTIRSIEERSYLLRRRVLLRFSAKSPTLRFGAKQ